MKDKLFILLVFIFVISFTLKFLTPDHVEATTECTEETSIAVEIKGQVKNPGVYTFTGEARIVDLINHAGGLMTDASIECINQSTILTDQMVVVIGSVAEVEEVYSGEEESVVLETSASNPQVIEVCTCEFVTVESEEKVGDDDLISLNEGSIDQLSSLPGIGETKAQAIIDYRAQTPFTDIGEIINVKGIGQSTYEKIKHLIKK